MLRRISRRDALAGLGAGMAWAALDGKSIAGDPSAAEIATAAARVDKVRSWSAENVITISGSNVTTRVRKGWSARVLRDDGFHAQLYFRFSEPRDLQGTALLIQENDREDNDVWLYLPSLGRPRRVVSSGLKNSFAGTEFAFADLMTQRVERFEHTLVGHAEIDGQACHIVESVPKSRSWAEDIGYSRERSWVHRETLATLQVEYQDLHGKPLKRQEVSSFLDAPAGKRIARKRVMANLQNGRQTVIELAQVAIDPPLDRGLFRADRLGDR